MLEYRFKGRQCIPSLDAVKDMANLDVTAQLVQDIIEEGDDYRNAKMSKGEVGRALHRGKLTVFVKLVPSYSYSLDEDVWVIKHVGIKRRRK